MKNKIMMILISLLFLINISNITISSESSNKIIYVDDDGSADYTKIQDAINNAEEGDTIFVYNGLYHEFIRINKSSIQLKGESKHSTIIDGSGSDRIIFITSSWISISNFTITNSSESGIGIQIGDFISSNNIILENNIISGMGYGILSPSTLIGFGNRHFNHLIVNNEIRNSRFCGIEFLVTDMSIIQSNNFTHNRLAINLEWSNGNIIKNNNFIENEINAVFDSALFTKCNRNYYSNHEVTLPYFIHGTLFEIKIPWLIIDLYPAQEPYDISC